MLLVMSVFGDFQRVWLQRFPNSRLPAAWEEDVRANLAKHKQKVALLKEELEKEEFYVEYLERLLSDVEEHKKGTCSTPPPPDSSTEEKEPTTKVSILGHTKNKSTSKQMNRSLFKETNDDHLENKTVIDTNEQVSNVEVRRSHSTAQQHVNIEVEKLRRNTDPSNFITVIEVNGLNKSNRIKSDLSPEIPAAKRKVPPK